MTATTTLILGGGFGGIAAANTLRRLLGAEHRITVIDRAPRFHVGAGKTWVMLGERSVEDISQARTNLLENGVEYVEAAIRAIDLDGRAVAAGRDRLHFDHLVIALGADVNADRVPGLAAGAQTFYTVEGAERLQPVLQAFRGGDIVLLIPKAPFKCPPAPYEAAMLLRHAFEQRGISARIAIHTVEGAPMATAGPEMGSYIREELGRRGIEFHPQKATTRVDGSAQRVVFADGTEARYDLLIAVPPHEAPAVVRDAGLAGPSGWIPVEPRTLHVTARPESDAIYAVGDVAVVPLPGRYQPDAALSLPKAGVFAAAHGEIAARQIAARILGRDADESFDGVGFCYLETGGARAVKADGSFFALPHPMMQRRPPDEAQFRDKLDWVARQLRPLR